MTWTFTPADAQIILAILASAIVPLVVGALGRVTWPAWAKLALAILISLIAGGLTEYAAGHLNGGSVIAAAALIFAASQAHYATWFKSLGLDSWLNPGEPQKPETARK